MSSTLNPFSPTNNVALQSMAAGSGGGVAADPRQAFETLLKFAQTPEAGGSPGNPNMEFFRAMNSQVSAQPEPPLIYFDGGAGAGDGGAGAGASGNSGAAGNGGGDGSSSADGFRKGGLIQLAGGGKIAIGAGGGLDDLIPTTIDGRQAAALSDGEFVIPADVVSMMGDGSSNAGAQRLYDIVKQVRQAKTSTAQQAGPLDIKSILSRTA